MGPIRLHFLFVATLTLGVATVAAGGLVPGGGSTRADCFGGWRVATPNRGPTRLDCEDGDPTCDIDGAVNGECAIGVAACSHLTGVDRCEPGPVVRADVRVRPRRLADGSPIVAPRPPALPVSETACGKDSVIRLPLRGVRGDTQKPSRRVTLRMVTSVRTALARDRDRLVLRCVPSQGGGQCRANPQGGPSAVRMLVGSGGDLDNGWTGRFHGFPIVPNAPLQVCLAGCDESGGECVQNDLDTPGANLETFGAPLPLLAVDTPLCVLNRFGTPKLTGFRVDPTTGEISGTVNLLSEVYRTSVTQVCPRCSATEPGGFGTCDGGPRRGRACMTAGVVTVQHAAGNRAYPLSADCPPSGVPLGTLQITIPLTTGVSALTGPRPCGAVRDDDCGSGSCSAACTGSACVARDADGRCIDVKGGVNDLCCSTNTARPCFATAGGAPIVRQGGAAPPFPAAGAATLVATFCEDATTSAAVNAAAGLPGPAALVLPVVAEWRR